MTRVHHFVPTFEPGAVGNHIEAVRSALEAHGIGGEVFAEHVHAVMAGRAHSFTDYGNGAAAAPDDLLVYHLAIGSVVADFVEARTERLAVWYHNVTPPEYLRPWEPRAAPGVVWGQRQLAGLALRASIAIADSTFNATDLVAAGYERPVVVPILLDFARFMEPPDPATITRLRAQQVSGGADLLFVGRLAPNKCQHDLVKVLAAVRTAVDPQARLRLVGGAEIDAYAEAIRELAAALGISDAVELAGSVSPAELSAYYATASVFVSVSEHEGFCVPVLEAMAHNVPVVAYGAGAIPETVGDGGLVLSSKDPTLVAAAVGRVTDERVRAALAAAGRQRLTEFAPERTVTRLLEVLAAAGVAQGVKGDASR